MMKFDVERTVSYWLEGAQYDLGVADAMFKGKKYPYALFMGHLALEKILKAVIVKNRKTHAPFTHSLPYLAENSKLEIPEAILVKLREFMDFISRRVIPMRPRSSIKNVRKPLRLKS